MIDNKTTFQMVEDLFQDTMAELQNLHEEKLELIRRSRWQKNQKELARARETLS